MPIRELFVECCGIICSVCRINTQKLGIVLKQVFCYLIGNQLFFVFLKIWNTFYIVFRIK